MNKRFTIVTGFGLFAVLLVLAIVFVKERIIIFDTSFQLFLMLRANGFAIQADRFGAVFTQIFPVIGSWLNLPLSSIIILYSTGFIVFYFACFCIILFVFKNIKLALITLLFLMGITTHTFFWIQCELYQGVVFTLVYLSWLDYLLSTSASKKWFYILSPVFIVTIIFFHPLLPFVFLFGVFYFLFHYNNASKLLIPLALIFTVLFFIKNKFFTNGYDNDAMSSLANFKWLFPNYFTIQSNKNFIHYCITDYYFIPILFFINSFFYFKNKLWYKLILFQSFFLGFLFIVNVSHQGGADQFYLESEYVMLMIFLSFPLLFDVFPAISNKLSSSIILIILLVGVLRVYNISSVYTHRLETVRQINLTYGGKKSILLQQNLPMNILLLSWSSSCEIWLLSTLETKQSNSIMIAEKENEFEYIAHQNKVFITKWEAINYSDLKNKKYFNFIDTSFYIKP
jgi:hypothetical protein